MKKSNTLYTLLAVVLFAAISLRVVGPLFAVSYKDFELLEGKNTSFWKKISQEDYRDLDRYKALYLKYWPDVARGADAERIPKVLHYIWLGPKEFPEPSIKYVQSWIEHHPKWKVKFWTDSPDRALPHGAMEKHLISEISLPYVGKFLTMTDNYGEKSDLLRYEILHQEGGVYIDHDIECYHSFDALVSSVDFFAGLEPPHHNKGIDSRIFPCNAVIGAKAFHPVLKRSLELVQGRWDEVENAFTGQDIASRTLKVLHRTFHSFTLATKEAMDMEGNRDIMFPASFFYPDRIVTSKVFDLWKSKGLIWTSHKCAGIWKPTEEKDPIYEQLEKEKAKSRQLKKQLKSMKLALYVSYTATAAGLFLLFRRKKKKARYGTGRF